MSVSPEWRLLWSPAAEYRLAVAIPAGPSSLSAWARALARPALVAFVTGIAVAAAATGRVTWGLVLSTAACWSFVPLLQVAIALVLIGSAKRPVSWARSLELFFLGHAAWSLWLLAAAAIFFAVPDAARHQKLILLTFLLPAGWTAILVFAFCRHVLQLDVKSAALRTVLHQALTYVLIGVYIGWAVQIWPRVLSAMTS